MVYLLSVIVWLLKLLPVLRYTGISSGEYGYMMSCFKLYSMCIMYLNRSKYVPSYSNELDF